MKRFPLPCYGGLSTQQAYLPKSVVLTTVEASQELAWNSQSEQKLSGCKGAGWPCVEFEFQDADPDWYTSLLICPSFLLWTRQKLPHPLIPHFGICQPSSSDYSATFSFADPHPHPLHYYIVMDWMVRGGHKQGTRKDQKRTPPSHP